MPAKQAKLSALPTCAVAYPDLEPGSSSGSAGIGSGFPLTLNTETAFIDTDVLTSSAITAPGVWIRF